MPLTNGVIYDRDGGLDIEDRIAAAAHAIHIDQPERFVDALRSAVAAGA
jgi:hypothetical protein